MCQIIPENTRCGSNAGSMLVLRLTRWPNIVVVWGDLYKVFAGICPSLTGIYGNVGLCEYIPII